MIQQYSFINEREYRAKIKILAKNIKTKNF